MANYDSNECVVCMEEKPLVVFEPCMHHNCCESCSGHVSNCPYCRADITGVYLEASVKVKLEPCEHIVKLIKITEKKCSTCDQDTTGMVIVDGKLTKTFKAENYRNAARLKNIIAMLIKAAKARNNRPVFFRKMKFGIPSVFTNYIHLDSCVICKKEIKEEVGKTYMHACCTATICKPCAKAILKAMVEKEITENLPFCPYCFTKTPIKYGLNAEGELLDPPSDSFSYYYVNEYMRMINNQ